MLYTHQKYVATLCRLHKRRVSSTTKLIDKNDLPAIAYQPAVVEKNKYENWERNDLFTADVCSNSSTFSMILPPPNVTGKLHLGHALTCTIQDVIVRRKRSLGYNVLWLPGTDHAGIATQGVVEKYLKAKHNVDRNNLTRETFNEEVWKWKENYGDTINQQLRTLGSSLDWSRQIFTMDPEHSHAVNTAFIELFQKGLIYRKKTLVNWCYKLRSTVSDIEVENIVISKPTEVKLPSYDKPVEFGLIYDFAYKIYDSNGEIIVSTTMPETMLGDVAVAVNPNDARYKHLRDKRLIHPFRKTTIPIIFDDFVNIELGTGAVKITPAHSKVDYDISKRHNLPLLQVIDENGCMENSEPFNSLNKYNCRAEILDKLNRLGLLRKIDPHEMSLPICSRTGDVIEYLPKEQWFLSCKELNKRAAEVVRNGQLTIRPEKFVKNWFNWTEDDRDWCISRQLWWGHQIPAYKCTSGSSTMWVAGYEKKSVMLEASKLLQTSPDDISVERDTDVLDTWFSSGIYPFSSLGWPKSNLDYNKFYPLSLMATGHDILGFWVHRMVILGLQLTETLPFNEILLHGIICDKKGAKMSKSKGNVIDPIDVINGVTLEELNAKTREMHFSGVLNKYEFAKAKSYHKANFSRTNGIPECGVDALRFTLLSQDVNSHYINFDLDLCYANKLFCNKIWQSIKYIQLSIAKLGNIDGDVDVEDLSYFDKWILSRLAYMIHKTNEAIEKYDFHIATRAIKTFLYYEFCDIYLEATKPGFEGDNLKMAYAHAHSLIAVLNAALRCLAPFMIYVTDEVIPKIPAFERNIICNFNDSSKKYFDFPMSENFEHWRNEPLERRVDNVINSIFLVRQLKGFYGIPNIPRPRVNLRTSDESTYADINQNITVFKHLTRCGDVIFDDQSTNRSFMSGALNKDTVLSVELIGEDINKVIDAARDRLDKKIRKAEELIIKLEAKVTNSNYIVAVPQWTYELEKEYLLNKKEELKQMQRLIM